MIGLDERVGRRFAKDKKGKTRRKVQQVLDGERTMLPPTFFKADCEGKVSVDRLLTEDTVRSLTSIARRQDPKFCGWAVLSVEKLRENELKVVPSRTDDNPFHSDVLPPSQGYDDKYTRSQILTGCIVDYQGPVV